jgi:peroxiredoxin
MRLVKNLSEKLSFADLKTLVFCLLVAAAGTAGAQNQTVVEARLTGIKAPFAKLGFYFGDKTYIVDSSRLDSVRGVYRFVGQNMRPGVYFIASGKSKIFDFIVEKPGTPLSFTMNAAKPGLPDPGNSLENQAFNEFQQYRRNNDASMRRINYSRDLLAKASHNDPAAMAEIEHKGKLTIDSLEDFVTGFIARNPNLLFAKMLRSAQSPRAPEDLPQTAGGKINPAYQQWMAAHYWDRYDFKDERLLYSEFFVTNLKVYIGRFSAQHPDSVAANIDRLLVKMPKDSQFYRFTVVYLTQQFESAADMTGLDRLFVHMVDTYQQVASTPWLDKPTLLRLEEKANYHRKNLTGLPAAELKLPDEKGNLVSLYDVDAPLTLLIFYSALCPHCMETMPLLSELYFQYEPKGLKAIAVNTDDQYEHWKSFLPEQHWTWINLADPTGKNAFQQDYGAWNLPVIYVLDKKKNILYKRIKPEKLNQVLQAFFK